MNDLAVLVESIIATPGEINELIGDNEVARLDFFAQTSGNACCYYMPYADRVQRRKIRLVRNFVRRNRMARTMPWQKSYSPTAKFPDKNGIRRNSISCLNINYILYDKTRQLAQARPPDNPNKGRLLFE